MKKNKVFLIVFILLAIIAGWLFYIKSNSTISEALRDFAVKDTGEVVKIFMADKAGQSVTLEKIEDNDWVLNGKDPARPDAIKTLLATLHDLEVRSPVGKSGYNNVIKGIATRGIKIEVYKKNGIFKVFYVGGPTQDQLGTFMYLENSTVPFIIHIPGFDGYLTPRFIVRPEDWRIKNVFRVKQGNLKSLAVVDRERPGFVFTITSDAAKNYKLLDADGTEFQNVSQDKIFSYLQFYEMINYEMIEKNFKSTQIDSIKATTPFRSISLTSPDGTLRKVNLWRRPQNEKTTNKANEAGTPYPYDIDRMVAQIEGDTSMIVVQYFTFEKLFRKPADFLNSEPLK
ncbi:MAG: DUF4340 domain-containing protein [Bacteroidetes bacterium]|nr:DUF4340 domain-containing protein [Bacteroidota bacterium]